MQIFSGDVVRLQDNQIYTVLDCNSSIDIIVLSDNNGNTFEINYHQVVKQYRGV